MRYRIIGQYLNGVHVTFAQNNIEWTFSTLEEAKNYLESIKAENVLPHKYDLKIEQVPTQYSHVD